MLWVDKNRCVGCGICANRCPKGIEMVDGKARIKNENADCLRDAANTCPRGAILFDEEELKNEDTNSLNQDYNQNNWMGQGAGQGRVFGTGRGMGRGGGMGRGRGQEKCAGRGMGRGGGKRW